MVKKLIILALICLPFLAKAQYPGPTGTSPTISMQGFYKITGADTTFWIKSSAGLYFPVARPMVGVSYTAGFGLNLTGTVFKLDTAATHGAASKDFVFAAFNTKAQDAALYATIANLALKAPLASPTFSGTVTITTLGGYLKATSGAVSAVTTIPYSDITGTPSALPPSGTAGGELAGTYPNPTILNSAVIAKVLTGYTSGAGTVASTDNVLQAFQKINGNQTADAANIATNTSNIALKANIASPTFTGTVTIPNGGVFGTPTSMTATNVTGLPLTTGVTGILPVANGGTGTASPGIVAGTNVTVTGTWPNQTINSSGGGGGGLLAANNLSDVSSMETSRQNLGIQDIWRRKGIVIYPSTNADQQTVGEPSVIVEGSPQIITGASSVFKMWFTQGWASPNIMYAESLDGVSWQRRATAVVTGRNRSFVFKNSSTYYMYAANTANTQLDQYTSTDGITWTLAHSAVVTAAGFSFTSVFSPYVFIEAGTWKMMLECLIGGNEVCSYLTSTDGITWTTPAGVTNPVVATYTAGNPYILKVGSTYWMYGHGTGIVGGSVPSDIYRQSSTDLKTWTTPVKVLAKQTADEGAGITNGIISDISMLQVGNSTYMYYTASTDGTVQTGIAHIKLAVANMTVAQLVTTNEGTGGDIITQQPPFVYDPGTNSLTYTGGNQNNSFNLAAPLYPNLNLYSNGTQIAQIGSGNSGNYTAANDFSIIANGSGNMSIEATNMKIFAPTSFQLPKNGSFGSTASLANGNWLFNSSTGIFLFYFNYKGSTAQQFIMSVAANQLTSPQNSNDFIFSNTGRMAFATNGSTQAAEFFVLDPSDKTGQFNRGLSAGFTSSKAALQTTSFSTGITATAKVANYTLTLDDHTVTADASGGAITETLPTAVGSQGIEYVIQKIDASANAVTVGTTSSQTIKGSTTYALSAQWQYVRVQSNNVSWIVVGNN